MPRHVLSRHLFKVGVLGLALLSGVLECAALLRARWQSSVAGFR